MRIAPHAIALLVLTSAFGQESQVTPEALLEKARHAALSYTASLPDFVCTQTVRRFENPSANGLWMRTDILSVKLSYFGHREDYKLITINGKPTDRDLMDIGGPTTKGEFGTLLLLLFHHDSQTTFHWKGWTTVHKHRLGVFAYRVDKEHSSYRVAFGPTSSSQMIFAPYHGEIHVDPESGNIVHVTQFADMPAGFPISRSDTTLDYDYAEVGGITYLLPKAAEVTMTSGRFRGKNLVEFSEYRKFQAESTITFGK
jgi:hypothetical protein